MVGAGVSCVGDGVKVGKDVGLGLGNNVGKDPSSSEICMVGGGVICVGDGVNVGKDVGPNVVFESTRRRKRVRVEYSLLS